MSRSYRELVGQLARLIGRRQAQQAEADAWRDRQCAAAEQAVRDAEAAVQRAEAAVAAARARLEAVDAEAAAMWRELQHRLGSRLRQLDEPPVPTTPDTPADPAALLEAARELINRSRQPGELPTSAYPLLAAAGLLGAACAYGLSRAARLLGEGNGGDLAAAMPVLGLVMTLLGPLVGLAPARLLADRRHAALDPRAVVVVIGAGLLATAVLLGLRP